MRTLKDFKKAIPLLCLWTLGWSSPVHAQTVPFKVFITELWQLDVGVDLGIGLIGDYYAKVTINGVEQNNSGACDDGLSPAGIIVPLQLFKNFTKISECKAKTPWVFSQQVPVGQPVHVRIQIFDSDLVSDDEADLKIGDGNAINLDVNPISGLWTGDVASPQNCSRPNLNIGGSNANVCWQLGFDTDDDGLLDSWEKFGVDTDNDGLTDIDLLSLGANPFRKDLFVELDYLQAATHTHAPTKDAVERIVTAFANAPVSNPDGTTGVQLHVDVGPLYGAGSRFSVTGPAGVVGTYGDLGGGNGIAEAGNEIIDNFGFGKGPGTNPQDLKAANFSSLREPIFRYAIFGHQTNGRIALNDCTSGETNTTRREFLVTLGGVKPNGKPCWGTDAGGFSVGFNFEQAGTFMHELGHALGLNHGGHDKINDKPNYLSVMNYTFQSCDVPQRAGLLPGGCDYSRLVLGQVLPTLDEKNLDECVGIAGGIGLGKVDWNGNNIFEGESQCGPIFKNIEADVNNDGVCVTAGPNGTLDSTEVGDDMIKENAIDDGKDRFCSAAVKAGSDDQQLTAVGETPKQPQLLTSFDDWSNLAFSLIDFSLASGATSGQAQEPEPDPTTVAESRRFMSNVMAPNIKLVQSGPATAKPGDLLTYSLTVSNTGRGPALSALLQEANPDGTVVTSDLDIVTVGSELTRARNFVVPANACPGDFTSAGASMSFKDFPGQGLTAATTTPLQILDVAPPTFEVSLSPAILWPPNHKFVDVTATLTFQDNCDRAPNVTLVSITSNEPEDKKDPDIQGAAFGTDDRTFSLRAERDTGRGATGRIYTVTYRVSDNAGNATVKSAIVKVPTSNSGQ